MFLYFDTEGVTYGFDISVMTKKDFIILRRLIMSYTRTSCLIFPGQNWHEVTVDDDVAYSLW